MNTITVTRPAADRLRAFHPWVYRTDIRQAAGDPGDLVAVHAPGGEFLGTGYLNPASEISVRILSFSRTEINRDFFRERLLAAFRKREPLAGTTNACRLVHAEADDLPGLVVDDYAGHLVVQINTLGMERLKDLLLPSFWSLRRPKGSYEKSDAASAAARGSTQRIASFTGTSPDGRDRGEGARFLVNLREGQKTGFFLDQRRNDGSRPRMCRPASPSSTSSPTRGPSPSMRRFAGRRGCGSSRPPGKPWRLPGRTWPSTGSRGTRCGPMPSTSCQRPRA